MYSKNLVRRLWRLWMVCLFALFLIWVYTQPDKDAFKCKAVDSQIINCWIDNTK